MFHTPVWFQSVGTRWPRVLFAAIVVVAVVASVFQPDIMASHFGDPEAVVGNYLEN